MFSELVKLPVYDLLKKSKRIADVGIELEVEGKYLPEGYPTSHWSAKHEGSLQNGMEYVSKPIKANETEKYVNDLTKYVTEAGGTGIYKTQIKPSYRCSTHIHVNMLGETVGDMLGFITIFAMFEPVLLSLCGPQRDGNLFCLSNYDTGDAVTSFDKLCSLIHYSRQYGFSYERGKYAALNLGRLSDLGTVEARCFPLSMDGAQVQKWVDWLMVIRDLARAQPDKTYREFWKLVRQNPQWYAVKIFGMDVYSVPNVSSLVDVGTETAYEFTKILKRWYNNKKEPDKKKTRKMKFTDSMTSADIGALYQSWSASAPMAAQPAPQPAFQPIIDDPEVQF